MHNFASPADRVPIPADAKPRLFRRKSLALLDTQARRRDFIQLRDVFDPSSVGRGAGKGDMQFHEEMRRDRNVEAFGQMRGLQPGRDAADTG